MFLDLRTDTHAEKGLRHNPFKALVAPRPIGWISTFAPDGTANLAPYSFFNAVSDTPPIVYFSSGTLKDSGRNAIESGVFAVNMVSRPMAEAMNLSSASVPADVSEFQVTGLKAARCETIDAPCVADAAAVLECRVTDHFHPKSLDGVSGSTVVFGQVTGIRMADPFVVDGRFDTAAAQLVSRLGYMDYASVDHVFEMKRPIL